MKTAEVTLRHHHLSRIEQSPPKHVLSHGVEPLRDPAG